MQINKKKKHTVLPRVLFCLREIGGNFVAGISQEIIGRIRQMDLLTYLRRYEPEELIHFSGSTYCTRTHDSLKISNGMWYWWSRGIGGRSALDYLIKVKGLEFRQVVEILAGAPQSSVAEKMEKAEERDGPMDTASPKTRR